MSKKALPVLHNKLPYKKGSRVLGHAVRHIKIVCMDISCLYCVYYDISNITVSSSRTSKTGESYRPSTPRMDCTTDLVHLGWTVLQT